MWAAEIGAEIDREEAEQSCKDEAWLSCEDWDDDELDDDEKLLATPQRCTESISASTPTYRWVAGADKLTAFALRPLDVPLGSQKRRGGWEEAFEAPASLTFAVGARTKGQERLRSTRVSRQQKRSAWRWAMVAEKVEVAQAARGMQRRVTMVAVGLQARARANREKEQQAAGFPSRWWMDVGEDYGRIAQDRMVSKVRMALEYKYMADSYTKERQRRMRNRQVQTEMQSCREVVTQAMSTRRSVSCQKSVQVQEGTTQTAQERCEAAVATQTEVGLVEVGEATVREGNPFVHGVEVTDRLGCVSGTDCGLMVRRFRRLRARTSSFKTR